MSDTSAGLTTSRRGNASNWHTPRANARRSYKKAQTALARLDDDYARRRMAALARIEAAAAEVARIEAELNGAE